MNLVGMQSRAQVVREGSDLLHLLRAGLLLEALAYEPAVVTAPYQHGESLLRHQAGRTDMAETFTAALHQTDKPVTLKDEMTRQFGGQHLYARLGETLDLVGHIL